jgi:hypothetical protein
MKMPSSVSKLLTNRYVLYLVSLLALFNVIGYVMMKQTQSVILFILFGYLTTHFSKNMVIVLLVPLVLVNLLNSGMMMKEGLDNMEDGNADKSADAADAKTEDHDVDMISQPTAAAAAPAAAPSATAPSATAPSATAPSATAPAGSGTSCPAGQKLNADGKCADSFEVGRKKAGAARVDYGTTLEKAYDDLSNVLGSDGIKNLTSDTQKLMKQQLQLAEAMENIGPLVQQAQSMLKTLNIDGMSDIPSLLQKFGVNAAAPK